MAGTASVNLLASLWALTVWTCFVAASIHGSKMNGVKIEQTVKENPKPILRTTDCDCPPPLIKRTSVTYSGRKHNDVATYACSVTSDVYIKGTTQVYCKNGEWETPTILCAPTTCWYDHPIWGPVYKGTQATTELGYTCNVWTSDSPHNKADIYKDDKAYTVDGSKAAAGNFCRLFKDNHKQAWCYTTDKTRRWDNCQVPHCDETRDCNGPPPPVNRTRVTYTGRKHNDVATYACSVTSDVYIKGTTQVYCKNGEWETPTILCAPTTCWYDHPIWGPVYKGTQTTTELGYTCNVWTSDSPHNKADIYKDDKAYTVDGSKAAAVNFCRLFKDNHKQAWCYTTDKTRRWDNCQVPHCDETRDCNGPPPPVKRTRVTYTGSKHNDVAQYSCSVTSDVYIKGTTQVYCKNGEWETPTILCAPTTCWYDHPIWGPVYKGTQATTELGYTCNVWTSDSPHNKADIYKDDKAYTVDGSKAAAVNFCRLFKDNHKQAWCYTTDKTRRWDNCQVPQCDETPVLLPCEPGSQLLGRKIAHVHVREARRSASVPGAIATLISSSSSNDSWAETIVCRADPTLVKELVSLGVSMVRNGSRWPLAYINSFLNDTSVSYTREDVVVEGTIYPYNSAASSLNVTSIMAPQDGSPVYTTTCTALYSGGDTSNGLAVSMADVKMRFRK
ncbi:plasminogen-like [Pomacea canaliculata]|uniref:plasminogen-like n=1 Tax=Pomacea canaliculata TaxID=400727 RepID=UPI000D73E248|nr:plasminogen-like [Pomacea canaliculata]